MARELTLRIKPPTAGGAQHLIQQLGTAVSGLGEGGKHVMSNIATRVNLVGSRDAILTFVPNESVSDDQLRAVAQVAATFSGPFRVEAEIGDAAVVTPSAARTAPKPAPSPAADRGSDEGGSAYAGWSKADLQDECVSRELPKSGTKDDLVSRLEEDDLSGSEGDDAADGE